jgi:hypothetical protein
MKAVIKQLFQLFKFNLPNKNNEIDLSNELWVKTFMSDDFEVSNFGRVRSLARVSPAGYSLKGKIKPLTKSPSGYLFTSIYGEICFVHQLVYYSFNGGTPSGHKRVIDHINNVRDDNRLENLRLVSTSENVGKNLKHQLPEYITACPYKLDRSRLVYIYRRNDKALKSSIHLDKVLAFKKEYEAKEGK